MQALCVANLAAGCAEHLKACLAVFVSKLNIDHVARC